jgi:hypothetical protein
LNFLRGLLGPRSVGLMKGQQARERRQLLHKVGREGGRERGPCRGRAREEEGGRKKCGENL